MNSRQFLHLPEVCEFLSEVCVGCFSEVRWELVPGAASTSWFECSTPWFFIQSDDQGYRYGNDGWKLCWKCLPSLDVGVLQQNLSQFSFNLWPNLVAKNSSPRPAVLVCTVRCLKFGKDESSRKSPLYRSASIWILSLTVSRRLDLFRKSFLSALTRSRTSLGRVSATWDFFFGPTLEAFHTNTLQNTEK